MKDAMISFRIPSSLLKELKSLAEANHYVDLSEQIREILRIKCSQQTIEAKQEPKPIQESTNKQRLVDNLQQILEELKKGM